MDDSAKERRRHRMIASRDAGWLSDSMKAAFTTGDAHDPIISARFLGDLGEELGGVISLSGGTIGDMLPPDFVRDAARDAVETYPHYPGVKGYRDFRQAIAAKLARENGIEPILMMRSCRQSAVSKSSTVRSAFSSAPAMKSC